MTVSTVARPALLFTLSIILVGCATHNPFDVPPSQAALLENTTATIDGAYYLYSFQAVDKHARGKEFISLRPGLIAAKRDASYLIPAGRRGIKILMIYGPEGVGAFKAIYYLWGFATVELKAGQTYRGRGRVYSDKALIWIEDNQGKRVSDKVSPFLVTKMH